MRPTLITLAALATATGTANATCPTAEDTQRGIYVVYSDKSYVRYQTAPDGDHILEDTTYVGDEPFRFVTTLRHGYLTVRSTDFARGVLDGATRTRTTYANGIDSYGPLKPETTLIDTLTERGPEGTEELSLTVTSEARATLGIGSCAYEGIPYAAEFGGNDPYTLRGVFLTDLGITVFTGFEMADENVDNEVMAPLTISVTMPQKGLLLR